MAFPVIGAALALVSFAPLIARRLGGGNAHTVATRVVEIAREVTGAADSIEAVRRLNDDTDMVRDFQKAIIQVEAEMELAILKDRQGARDRDIALMAAGRSNVRANLMVLLAVVGLSLCLGVLAFFSRELPGEAVGAISTIAGVFGICLKNAYTFEFGPSKSGRKNREDVLGAATERSKK